MEKYTVSNYDEKTKVWSGVQMEPLHNLQHHSLGTILYAQMRNAPNKVIQIDDVEGKGITNQEALTWAIRIAQHLKKMRFNHDNIVGLAARNSTYVMPLAMGCLLNCVPLHAVNPNLDESTLAHCFGITKPQIIFCDGSDYEKILESTKLFRPLIYTVCQHIKGVASVLDLLEPTKTELFYQPEKLTFGADQTVVILCSSGTTGLPKAVTIVAQKLIVTNPVVTSEDVIFAFSGLDWMTGIVNMIKSCYYGCTRIITSKNFTPEYFVELVKKYKMTNVTLPPRHTVALAEYPQFTAANVGSITVLQCPGSCITNTTLEKVQKVIPHSIICNHYGLTEVGYSTGYSGATRDKSAGKLMTNIKLKIIDEHGRNLGPNEAGEILLNSPYHWAGYYGNPDETQRMRDSLGWFHTGDLGYMNDDGYLFVIDRLKEICKYMGYQYWPSEIENVIRELPDVVDCCVVGIFDEHFGDVAGAFVIKSPGSMLKEQDIVDHVKLHLNMLQKQLHNGVVFIDQLPQNSNGKTVKKEAKELFKKLKNLN